MKIILVSKRHGNTRSFTLGVLTRTLLSACIFGVPMGLGYLLWSQLSPESDSGLFTSESREAWVQSLDEQQTLIELTKRESEQKVAALTLRVAELQARLVRIDALGERLTSMAKLDRGEFDFSLPPALGGPTADLSEDIYTAPSFMETLDQLNEKIVDRQQQLETLEALLANKKLEDDVFLAGRPIKKGWMSSRFGRRTDPFTGGADWHPGVDFAAKENSEIVAVASGVVTWADERYQYGTMVEVNHGNGFKTRYAHCKSSLVKVGDIVKKGQVIALVGSTGRSTGPHVHFEVHKNGRVVDPATYIHRASR